MPRLGIVGLDSPRPLVTLGLAVGHAADDATADEGEGLCLSIVGLIFQDPMVALALAVSLGAEDATAGIAEVVPS